jgi:hypothetical protein
MRGEAFMSELQNRLGNSSPWGRIRIAYHMDAAYDRMRFGWPVPKATLYDLAANVLIASRFSESGDARYAALRNHLLDVLATPDREDRVVEMFATVCVSDHSQAEALQYLKEGSWSRYRCRPRSTLS